MMKKINLALILLFACIILLSSVFGARRHRSYHRDTFDTEHDGQDYFTDSSKDYSEKECKVGFSLRGKERNINHRIAGGRDAKEGEFPSFISLAVGYSPYDTYQFCSGVALTKTFILTAGHCFDGLGASETIWAAPGIYPPSEWRNHRELKIYRVVQRCPSPKLYENPEGAIFYDYQIVRVSEPMNNVKFARLNARADLPMGFKAVVVGVGYTEIIFGESFTHETYTKKLQVLPVELAKCAYDLPDHESHICFQSYKTTMVGGPCKGDSGGPVYGISARDGTLVVAGVVSYGPLSCTKGLKKNFVAAHVAKGLQEIESLKKNLHAKRMNL